MILKTLEVAGMQHAIYSMRNPLNSWDKSDSRMKINDTFELGPNDLDLAQRLIKAGPEHMKFMRFITVWADWELPLYVWKEADTYKFLEKNSCSTMHKITSRPLEISDFEIDAPDSDDIYTIATINSLINRYKELPKDAVNNREHLFRKIVQKLPSAFLQKRTIVTNYAELRNIYKQRHNHKLKEWHIICDWICSLPHAAELITYGL